MTSDDLSKIVDELVRCKNDYDELLKKYNELNDFSNSQLYKVLQENAELKAQIKKMKCCCNCINSDISIGCKLLDKEITSNKNGYCVCTKWELIK